MKISSKEKYLLFSVMIYVADLIYVFDSYSWLWDLIVGAVRVMS